MKLYNTLTRQIEPLRPLAAPRVTVYTCGPTVYDYPHVGNWFTFIRYDCLVRALALEGLQPDWVMNLTDVGHLTSDADEGEDKLEKGARREGKTAWDVAAFYGDYFVTALQRLSISTPQHLPKATDHIAEQIALIEQLNAKGYTYVIDDGVYYDTGKFPGYAAFARLDLDDLQAGARVEYNTQKRNPADFALWKFSPENTQRDMEWASPFTDPAGRTRQGFPGWHLECSAMCMKYLGKTIDVHAGGIDHIPVHHTNEIAQSEAATGQRFANHWMHANHIMIQGEKISKSLGNGITLEDIEAKGFSLAAFRLHVLESHYRSQSKFSWESLAAAQNRLAHWRQVAALRWQVSAADAANSFEFDYYQERITEELTDDLNTPAALAVFDAMATNLEADQASGSPINADNFAAFLRFCDQAFGLHLIDEAAITPQQTELLRNRQTARDGKDWPKADELRDALLAQGIGLRDTPQGAVWFRT